MSLVPCWALGPSWPRVEWVDQHTIVYISGNNVVVHNVSTGGQSIARSAGRAVSCFALNRKFNLIAYTERNEGYHPHIRVCRLPEGGSNDFKRLVTIEATHGDEEVLLDYSALAFSSDGRFMAACGGVPSPSVTVWDWAEHQARCTIPLPALAESVSFDPYDRYLLCVTTSKGSRLIRVDEFASTPAGCEVLDMSTDSGAVVSHAWLGKHRLLAGTATGRLTFLAVSTQGGRLEVTSHTPPDVEATGPITHISVNAAFACCAVRGSSKVHVFRRRPATPEEAYDQAGTGPEEPAAELSMTRGSRREGSMGRTSRREGSKREVQSTQEGPEEVGPSAEALDPVAAAKVPSEITHLSMGGPECASLLAVCRGGDVVTCDVSAPDVSFESLLRYHPGKVLAFLPVSADVVVSADSTGRVISWDLSTGTATAVLQCRATVTAATACHKERIIALGSSLGHLRVVRASEDGSLELVFRSRLHREAIAHVCTSPSGTSIATVSSSHRLYFTVLSGARWRPLGFVFPPDGVVSMCWPAAGAVAAPLLLLTSAEEVVWVQAPGEDAVAGKDHKLLAKYAPMKRMRLEHQIITAAGIPSKDMPSMLGMTNDRALHLYTIPKELQNWTTANARGGRVHAPEKAVTAHEEPGTVVTLGPDQQHSLTASADGSVRLWGPGLASMPVAPEGMHPHSHLSGGVSAAAFAGDGTVVLTGGCDGAVIVSRLSGIQLGAPEPESTGAPLCASLPAVEEAADTEGERDAAEVFAKEQEEEARKRAASNTQRMLEQVEALRKELHECIERNQEAEELERLTEEELIVNRGLFERKVAEQAEAVNVVVERQRGEGLRMDVIRERVLEHCWHSAATKPAVVAAIRAPIRVTNFPIPKESRMGRLASKVLLLRQAEMRQRAHLGLAEWSACLTTAAPVGQSAGADAAASGQAPAGGGSGGVSSGQAAATGGGQKGGAAAGGAKGAAAGSGAGGGSGQGSESNELQCATLTEGWAAGACQDSGMEGVLYDPLDLVPRSRRVVQVYLLYLRAAAAKEAFNKRFDAVVMEKHSDLERIREFNTRIREILADLDRLSDSKRNGTEEVWAPEMLEEEDPEWMLKVKDSEISVEKYLTRAERAKRDAQLAEEAARKAAMAKDNAAERALKAMMGGTLERPEEEDESLVLVRPAFMDTDQSKWTEDQKKAAQEYRVREAQVKEEKEKRLMGLETELRTMRQNVEEVCAKFDQSVDRLRGGRMQAEFAVAALERRMVRLALVADEMLRYSDEKELELQQALTKADQNLNKKSTEVIEAKEAVVVQARVVEGLMQEDRQHDKAARRDLAEVPEHTAALLALYRKRVYQQAPQVHMQRHLSRRMSRRGSMGAHALGRKPSSRGGGLSHAHGSVASRPSLYGEDSEGSVSGATSGQPFEALVGAFGSLQDAAPGMGDLDPHPGKGAEEVVMEHVAPLAAEEMPAGLDLGWWERLQGLRDAKIDVERRLRRQQKLLARKQGRLAALEAQEAKCREELEKARGELEEFLTNREKLQYDIEVPLLLRQGQVESMPGPGQSLLEDGILIDVEEVQGINTAIREQGKKKIDILQAIKEFKTGIYDLEWHNKRLGLEAADLKERTRELQLLRVTKELQEALKAGPKDGGAQSQGTGLEKLMKHAAGLHAKRMEEKARALASLERQKEERAAQNEDLKEQVAAMEGLVRKEGRILQSKTMSDNAASVSLISRRMRTLVTKARLRDIAAQQAEEIALLEAEVDRLRARTYPTFVTVVHDMSS